jgi:hypothetical protein
MSGKPEITEQTAVPELIARSTPPAPVSLISAVDGMIARSRRRNRRAVIAIATTALSLLLAITLITSGGEIARGYDEALARAVQPPIAPPPGESDSDPASLNRSIGGAAFPYWGESLDWRAVGSRRGAIAGRRVETVYYKQRSGPRVAYSIFDGKRLPDPDGTVIERGGRDYRVLRAGAITAVAWVDRGHTCVLSGIDTPLATLMRLASWERAI